MKRVLAYFLFSILLISSCNRHTEQTTGGNGVSFVNNLVPPTSCITYVQDMYVPEEYFFFKGIDFATFLDTVRQRTLNKSVTPYLAFSDIILQDGEIHDIFGQPFPEQEYRTLLFDESWALDTSLFVMKKKVRSYSLIREYIRQSEYRGSVPTKSIVARYVFPDSIKRSDSIRLIAEDVAYEVLLQNNENPEFLENMQVSHVVKTIVEKFLSASVPAYSFAYRDTLIPRGKEEVEQSLGKEVVCYTTENDETFEIDTVCFDKDVDLKEIGGLAFIEDWYLDSKTLEIIKQVKAIAPVRMYYHTIDENTEPELIKSIPFVMYLNQSD